MWGPKIENKENSISNFNFPQFSPTLNEVKDLGYKAYELSNCARENEKFSAVLT
jgi:hypothetical protein